MSASREFIKLSRNKREQKGHAQLNSIEFVNDGYYIIYLPSLNLSAYGKNHAEALYMMDKVVMPDFFKNLLDLSDREIIEELSKFGWEKSQFFKLELSKAAHIDKEGILRDFELSEDTLLTEGLVTV